LDYTNDVLGKLVIHIF